ncbi:zinc-finger domain-containing protein [Novosphingopyxis sp.]|uniref:zinc-finger domain-containing protein n=1 Tax=Novosphingopyxis sp. TaxID=2709690 RepID=UPI003B5C1118
MIEPPETIRTPLPRVACDGAGEISSALGHPRVWLEIAEEIGWVDCGYCDRHFVLVGGPADGPVAEARIAEEHRSEHGRKEV